MLKNSRLLMLLVLNSPVSAEIITDGTLGTSINLPGPDFQIEAQLGQQIGDNLFHSFQDFNLQDFESATFSGPNSVQNVISRVTGGNSSHINGLIRSTIPNADMYFLNPYGIMFGPHAKLDVQGSFHASTADYLRLGEVGRFEARLPRRSVLTVAPPTAFGFLDAPAPIQVQGSELTMDPQTDFSLIGGDLILNRAQLNAASGRFNLVSIGQTEEVSLPQLEIASVEKQGIIRISAHTNLNVNGVGGGEIFIQGGQLLVEDSILQANTLGEQNGRGIKINLTESINLKGKSAQILSLTSGSGHAGPITVTTPNLTINQGELLTRSFGKGSSGDIQVDTLRTAIYEGGVISNSSSNEGHAGDLTIIAKEGLFLVDKRIFLERESAEFVTNISSAAIGPGLGGHVTISTSQLILDGAVINSHSHTQGDAGEITIEADSVELRNGGLISATTFSQSTGKGGNIALKVKESVHIEGFRAGFSLTSTDTFENVQSGIGALTFGSGSAGNIHLSASELTIENQSSMGAATGSTGNAGNLIVEVDDLYLNNGGLITNSSGGVLGGKLFLGTGAGGMIKVVARNRIIATGQGPFYPSGILSNTLVSGLGGYIEIQTPALHLAEGAEISAGSSGTGNAGMLNIQADIIRLSRGGHIFTSAQHATGGNIRVTSSYLLDLNNAQITTSVGAGKGQGGDIKIENPQFIVLNQGQIRAQADEGHGGNIYLIAKNFLKTSDSLVSASSRLGIDGEVLIESPNEAVGGNLLVLPTGFIDVSGLLPRPCEAMTLAEYFQRSSFRIKHIAVGSLLSPFDLKPSPPLTFITNTQPSTPTVSSKSHLAKSSQPLALLTSCHKL
jgi:filamentous hemagglutinin family protein